MVGERIKKLRTSANISQSVLGKHLNVSQQAVANWEQGLAEPSIDAIKKMSEFFDCTTDFLLGISDCKNSFDAEQREPLVNNFIKTFSEFDLLNLFLGQIQKIINMVDPEDARLILYNIVLIAGFHLRIADDFSKRYKRAKELSELRAKRENTHLHLSEIEVISEKIIYLTQRDFISYGTENANYIKDATIKLVNDLYTRVRSQSNLHEKYDNIQLDFPDVFKELEELTEKYTNKKPTEE